jgi:hypothetical protein
LFYRIVFSIFSPPMRFIYLRFISSSRLVGGQKKYINNYLSLRISFLKPNED